MLQSVRLQLSEIRPLAIPSGRPNQTFRTSDDSQAEILCARHVSLPVGPACSSVIRGLQATDIVAATGARGAMCFTRSAGMRLACAEQHAVKTGAPRLTRRQTSRISAAAQASLSYDWSREVIDDPDYFSGPSGSSGSSSSTAWPTSTSPRVWCSELKDRFANEEVSTAVGGGTPIRRRRNLRQWFCGSRLCRPLLGD